ncbi:hypothetical protein AALA99_13645 [Anaerotruncus colihominis]
MTDTKAVIDAINAILKRGNDVQIQRNKDRLVVLEVKKEVKYIESRKDLA